MTMRALAVLTLVPFALAACGERADEAAPTAAEVVSALKEGVRI